MHHTIIIKSHIWKKIRKTNRHLKWQCALSQIFITSDLVINKKNKKEKSAKQNRYLRYQFGLNTKTLSQVAMLSRKPNILLLLLLGLMLMLPLPWSETTPVSFYINFCVKRFYREIIFIHGLNSPTYIIILLLFTQINMKRSISISILASLILPNK